MKTRLLILFIATVLLGTASHAQEDLDTNYKKADTRLNAVFQALQKLSGEHIYAENCRKALREAQRAWVQFRDAEAELQVQLADIGSPRGREDERTRALIQLTEKRIEELKRMLPAQ